MIRRSIATICVASLVIASLIFTAFRSRDDHATASSHDGPNDLSDRTIFDFGALRAGTVVEHHFSVENKTGVIWQVSRSGVKCGCLRVVRCSDSIAPGESLEFVVQARTAGFRGKLDKEAFVELATAPGRVNFRVQMDVLEIVRLEESTLVAARSADGEFSAQLSLLLPGAASTASVHFESATPGIELSLGEPIMANGTTRCPIKVHMRKSTERQDVVASGIVKVSMGDGSCDALPFRVIGRRSRPLHASPGFLTWNASSAMGELVEVRSSEGTGLDVDWSCIPEGAVGVTRGSTGELIVVPTTLLRGGGSALLELRHGAALLEIPIVVCRDDASASQTSR